MPDQTKSHGLRLALNSLESALKVCEATISGSKTMGVKMAIIYIEASKRFLQVELDANDQQPPFVGEDRRTK